MSFGVKYCLFLAIETLLTRMANKRLRTATIELADVLRHARMIWGRDPVMARTTMTEDRSFREYFGCGAEAALALWALILSSAALPEGGSLQHMLWTLMFMKVYAKSEILSRLTGGADKSTIRKWVWQFIEAIASLESQVVSVTRREFLLPTCHHMYLIVFAFTSSCGYG
jgi:hypothetical protein